MLVANVKTQPSLALAKARPPLAPADTAADSNAALRSERSATSTADSVQEVGQGNSQGKQYSLHGASAAKRQATQELLFFASAGDLVRCQLILKTWSLKVTDENCCDYDKRTPLHLAAAEGCYSVVRWLLEGEQAPPNKVDRFGRTPLEEAVRNDHGQVTRLLVDHGAKVAGNGGKLIDLASSHLSRYVRVFDEPQDGELQPEWEIDPGDLVIKDKVGEGEFGAVHRGTWHGATVAIKVLRRSDAVALGDFRTELNVLQKVHHPHTVQFLGACTKVQPYMIVTEFCPGGSLADLFSRARREGEPAFPTPRRALQMALGCARGMAYLHSPRHRVVIHRDLKPANLMLGGTGPDGGAGARALALAAGVVKIADFGLSKSLALNPVKAQMTLDQEQGATGKAKRSNSSPSYLMTGETGSYRYMAPEVFRHEPYNSKVDVYAFAMILFELLEGFPPFGLVDPIEAARRASLEHARPAWGARNRYGHMVPPELRKLVERCWAPDYDDRPDFEEVCEVLEAALADAKPDLVSAPACCTVM